MLDLDVVDLDTLCEALEDHSGTQWFLDRATGKVFAFFEEGPDDEDERDLTLVDPIPGHEAYGDMQDFVSTVANARARDLLGRAIEGRGAFRRFKDTLIEFPDLRDVWFRFHDARMRRRAIEWLEGNGYLARAAAQRALAAVGESDLTARQDHDHIDGEAVARAVAGDLRELYGPRLRDVVLYGSWARGDAHPESDIDLLVVLDRIESARDERDRMDDILWQRSLDNTTVVCATPITLEDFDHPKLPALIRAAIEGKRL